MQNHLSINFAAEMLERTRRTIKRALRHVPPDSHERGQPRFPVVEVVRPCPAHFGRYNDMKETPDMLRWLRGRAVPVETYRTLSQVERHTCFPIGSLVDRDGPDFNDRYESSRARAASN